MVVTVSVLILLIAIHDHYHLSYFIVINIIDFDDIIDFCKTIIGAAEVFSHLQLITVPSPSLLFVIS